MTRCYLAADVQHQAVARFYARAKLDQTAVIARNGHVLKINFAVRIDSRDLRGSGRKDQRSRRDFDQARREVDQNARKTTYAELQRILAEELPYIDLWYLDNVLVHNRRVRNIQLNPAGNYDFLRSAELAPRGE